MAADAPGVRGAPARDARPGRPPPTRTAMGSIRPQEVERINYDTAINGRLIVYGQGGNDFFASTTTARSRRSTAALGNDTLPDRPDLRLEARRARAPTTTPSNTSGGSLDDRRTSSAPSRRRAAGSAPGNSAAARRGRRQGRRRLHRLLEPGGAAARGRRRQRPVRRPRLRARARRPATASADSTSTTRPARSSGATPANQIAMPRLTSGFSTAAETDIRTGAGTNQVQYNINAPVSIDGGNGFDKVVVLGTEFADHIVVTEKAIYGAGLAVTYAERRGARDRRPRGRRHVRRPLDRARRRDARHRRPRQRHDQRRRRRGRRRRLARHRGHERHDQPRRLARATRSTTASSPTASTSASRAPTQGQVVIEETGGFTDVREGGVGRHVPRLPRGEADAIPST